MLRTAAIIVVFLIFIPGWLLGDQLKGPLPREKKEVEKRAIKDESGTETSEDAHAVDKTKNTKKGATALIKLLQAMHLSR